MKQDNQEIDENRHSKHIAEKLDTLHVYLGKYLSKARRPFPSTFCINLADYHDIWCADVKRGAYLGWK